VEIIYQQEQDLDSKEFIELLVSSTLGERRPVNEPERIEEMLRHANLTITARHNGKLVGLSRSLTDWVYATYLSDLAVHIEYQHKGIGKELIRQTKLLAPKSNVILLSAPAAVDYYPKIGMTHHAHAFWLRDIKELK
jgi:predicted N-acetyltransferase YhbS